MGILTEEMKRVVTDIQLCYAATVTPDGNPQHYLADVLARIADHPIRRLDELLPWHWRRPTTSHVAATA